MDFSWQSKKAFRIIVHVLAWLLFFSLPFLLTPTKANSDGIDELLAKKILYQHTASFLTWIVLYYFNANYLIPRLINRKQYLKYFIALLPLFLALSLINWLSFHFIFPEDNYSFKGAVIFYLLPSLFVLSISTAVTMFQNKMQADRLEQLRESENMMTELAMLRSQVSPHFLFNILNNMVLLARKKSDLLEPSLFKLSSLLRYMLYESDSKVLLEKEVEYLQSYIDLQLQRFGSKLSIKVEMSGVDRNLLIEPMLLIPFVENAFKHGTGFKELGNISIELSTEGKQLDFRVQNYFDQSKGQVKDKTSGIGLQNVKRRLNLLYKEEHQLSIDEKNNLFTVNLQIKLH